MRHSSSTKPVLTASDPDLATRQFLHLLTQTLQNSHEYLIRTTPILCLVDHDPHGLEILATYKFGSSSMAAFNEGLAIPTLRWIGVHASDYDRHDAGVLPFTKADTIKLESLLHSPWLEDSHTGGEPWLRELTIMKEREVKAEIEILSERAGGLSAYLCERIRGCQWL